MGKSKERGSIAENAQLLVKTSKLKVAKLGEIESALENLNRIEFKDYPWRGRA